MEFPRELSQYKRVLQLATQPSNEEFTKTAQIAGLGILLVGFIGFAIFIVMTFFPG